MKKSLSYLIMAGIVAGCFLATPVVKAEPQTVTVSQTHDSIMHVNTLQHLDDIIAGNEYVAIDIGTTTWCSSCKKYAPVFKAVAEKYKTDIVFCKVILDGPKETLTQEGWEIVKKYNVKQIPKTILFKDGKEVFNKIGYMNEKELSSLIEKYLLSSEY